MTELFHGSSKSGSSKTDSGDENSVEEDPYSPSTYIKSVYVTDQGTLMAEVSVQSVWDNDVRYRKYLTSEDSLAYLLNAEVVSQYPYVESASKSDLNGSIKFFRNNMQTKMTCVSSNQFSNYVNSYNFYGDESSKNNALNSFCIEGNGTIKIAYVATRIVDGVTYSTLETQTLAYKNLIQKYTIQFELLWAIVTAGYDGSAAGGNSEDFARAVASMAYDGDIELVITDNFTTTTTTETFVTTVQEKISYSNIVLEHDTGFAQMSDFETEPVELDSTTTTTTTVQITNSPRVIINKIESWCATLENNVKFETNTSNTRTEDNVTEGEYTEWESQGATDNEWAYEDCGIEAITSYFANSINSSESVILYATIESFQRSKTDKTTKVNTQTTSYSITTSSPELNEDIIKLFKVISYSGVKQYLTEDFYTSFINIIKSNETTANMADLINYIFNELTGTTDYGEDLEFETAWEKAYQDYISFIGGSSGIDGNVGIVYDYFLSKGISPVGCAAIIGNFYGESGVIPNNLEDSSNNKSGVSDEDFTARVNSGSITRAEFISSSTFGLYRESGRYMTYGYGLGQWTWPTRKAGLYDATIGQGYNIDDINAQLDYAWQEIQSPSFDDAYNAVIAATDINLATKGFMKSFEGIEDDSLGKRQNYAREVYEQYKQNSTNTTSQSVSNTGANKVATKVIEMAESKLGCAYVWGAAGPNTFDCSGLVQWCYKQAGVTVPRTTYEYPSYNQYRVNLNEIQPGDVLWNSGHVGIYIGNGIFIHSPHTGDVVKKVNISTYNPFNYAYRFWEM